LCAATLTLPPYPYRPSYLFLPTLALFLFPTLPSVIPATLTRIPLPIHRRHSFNRPRSTAFARIDWNPDLTKNRSDISADQDHQSFSPPTSSPQTPNTYLKRKSPRGLKSHSLPPHNPEVATIFTKYLGEAQTNERWMTKHRRDCSLPLPSMTLSNRLHIQPSVH
jgi:hypothetical protein